ncbi:MAG: hypothetical protein CMA63_03805 [Euryarchaeota archaeon]|nr:hypothetical protein [Euryarchaeota archaeon]|tara:strand:+ start:8258 stop:8563 length:306 start_codon:yes stop_codon:yes gene_type:complete
MRTCVDNLIALSHVDGPRIRNEVEFLANRLEILRQKRKISNDAYLDAGAIQGAFDMIGNLVEMGVPQNEIFSELKQQLSRACKLEEKHPGLDKAIEDGRAS